MDNPHTSPTPYTHIFYTQDYIEIAKFHQGTHRPFIFVVGQLPVVDDFFSCANLVDLRANLVDLRE